MTVKLLIQQLLSLSVILVLISISALLCLIVAVRCIYRLTLHPLAKFPGPKSAAITSLYGALWDVPLRTSFVREFSQWHDRYESDVIRIAPNHLHIRDFDSYAEIFKIGSKFARDPSFYQFPLSEGSFWTNPSIKEGLSQRSLYHQYFSRTAVHKLEPSIQRELSLLLAGVDKMRKAGSPVDLTMACRCFSADTLGTYMFDQSFGFLNSTGFQSTILMEMEELVNMMPVSWYCPKLFANLVKLFQKIPRSWADKIGVSATLTINDTCSTRIQEIMQRPPPEGSPNIFQNAFNSISEKGQRKSSLKDLIANAVVFFTAGSESTANMLSYCIYHLHQQPSYLRSLRAELAAAIPSSATLASTSPDPPTFPVSWTELEKLPLLRAAVKETLRICYGVPGKLPRVVPAGGAFLAGRQIPEGTIVSSCSYIHHNNEKHYPNALDFRPSRWLISEDGLGPDRFRNNGGVDPEKHLITFSRGSRNCLGMHLGYAELYVAIAYLLRNFEMELFDTTPEDMDWHDSLVTVPFGHLKVKIVDLID